MIGRFVSADSIIPNWFNPQALNRYTYVLNNPLAYVDPNGHDAESTWLNWLKSNPRNRVGELRFNYATQEQKREALPYLRQFQHRLHYMESKGVNVDDLSTETLDQEYTEERGESRGINAISAGALFGPAAAKAKGTTNASKETLKITNRTTRGGDNAVRIEYPDGRIKDISPKRVKEYVPNTHPKAPPGTKQKVKFDNALPGTKGYKRAPTSDEMKHLEKK